MRGLVRRLRDIAAALRRGPLRTLPRRALLRLRYGPSRIDAAYLEARALASWRAEGRAELRAEAVPLGTPLDVAFVVPFFYRGSGGHTTLSNLVRALERRGHRVTLWLDDPGRRLEHPERAAQDFREWFGPFAAGVHASFDAWRGADVAVATGYQTVLRVRTLSGCGARAYLVQDHEPEFFGTSAERVHAEESYRYGLHPITAGTWLADLMRDAYALDATPFELAVDHAIYRQHPDEQRQQDVVVFYARAATGRRAVPIGVAALAELKRRRPQTEVWLYGQRDAVRTDFPVTNLGVVSGPDLARVYARATVGLCLSLTNYSLVPQEMLACGLPCVEADAPSAVAAFGREGPVAIAPVEPHALAAALARLLDDPAERARRAQAGRAFVAPLTWDAAGERLEAGLRAALERRSG
jgi:glycosyltransferase involved in cell wall biosynthesis